MMKSAIVAVALAAHAASAAAADWEGVFEGTLGGAAIIVELNAGPDKTEYKGGFSDGSRYSYLPNAFDLKLVLDSEGKTLEFTESVQPHDTVADLPRDDPAITGQWSLDVSDEGASGTWTSVDGKRKLPIRLKRLELVDKKDVPQAESQLTITYGNRWFETETISGAINPKTFGAVTLAFERDSVFNLDMPMFINMPDKTAMEQANRLLRNFYRKSLLQYRDCINGLGAEPKKPFEPEYNFSILYASPRVVSIQESGSVYCGGNRPNEYVTFWTFDLVSGKTMGGEYNLDFSSEGFGKLLKLGSKEERAAFEKYALQRWYDAAKAAGDTGKESCSGSDLREQVSNLEKRFSLAFAEKGLAIYQSGYLHVAVNCRIQDYNPTIIPWAEVKPWLKPGQVLLKEEVE